jgi:hypothetical protein
VETSTPGRAFGTRRDAPSAITTGNLAPQRFGEFPFIAANPKSDGKLVWPAYQTYADGERIEWTGDEGTKRPASVTAIARDREGPVAPGWVGWAALGVAVVAFGLVLRRPAQR